MLGFLGTVGAHNISKTPFILNVKGAADLAIVVSFSFLCKPLRFIHDGAECAVLIDSYVCG